ncbi:MAG: sugar ABC transporter permease YjfF [Tepidisphaerales bacterium]
MTLPITRQHLPVIAALVALLLLYTGASIAFADRGYLTAYSFFNLFHGSAILGVAAVGMAFVILSGGIDLSVGGVVALVSISTAVLIEHGHIHPLLAWSIMLAAGALIGLTHGALITFFDLPPFLVTLAGMFFCRGLALRISENSIEIGHPLVRSAANAAIRIGSGMPPGRITIVTDIFITVLVLGTLLSLFTRFGRNVYAIGGNETSARLMGLPVSAAKVGIYVLSGFCAALAGVCHTIANTSGDALNAGGNGFELDAIAAVVIGGTLLSGGVGYVASTILGVLILGIIQTIPNFRAEFSAGWTKVVIGALLLVFVVLQKIIEAVTRRRKA